MATQPARLYAPASQPELLQILALECTAFPNRPTPLTLASTEDQGQALAAAFHPVSAASGYVGYTLVFQAEPDFVKALASRPAATGNPADSELLVEPAQLADLNRALVGLIKVAMPHFGMMHKGAPATGEFVGLDAAALRLRLAQLANATPDIQPLLWEHRFAIALNQLWWQRNPVPVLDPNRQALVRAQTELRKFLDRHPWLDLAFTGGFGA